MVLILLKGAYILNLFQWLVPWRIVVFSSCAQSYHIYTIQKFKFYHLIQVIERLDGKKYDNKERKDKNK